MLVRWAVFTERDWLLLFGDPREKVFTLRLSLRFAACSWCSGIRRPHRRTTSAAHLLMYDPSRLERPKQELIDNSLAQRVNFQRSNFFVGGLSGMTREKSLLSSAQQFLIEALENHNDRKHHFAIVHAVTAAELLLKERLARIHPALIFRNVDAATFRGEQTVPLAKLPQRLSNFGVEIRAQDAKLVGKFAEWRNQIVHHMPSFDAKVAESQLPQLLDFLAAFLRNELHTLLEEFLPKRMFKTVGVLLKEWERVVEQARAQAQKEGNILSEPCPACGATAVLCLRNEKRVFCHLCEAKHYHYDHCTECGRQTVSSFAHFDEGNWCDSCIEAAGNHHIQMLIDIERGK
jgi:hypothetical protein